MRRALASAAVCGLAAALVVLLFEGALLALDLLAPPRRRVPLFVLEPEPRPPAAPELELVPSLPLES